MAEPPAILTYTTLYEDDHLLTIDKPGNLPCHPGGHYCENTLLHLLRKNGLPTPYIINRLDRETSGIILVAKDSPTAASLAGQFRRHTVKKEYITLCHGHFPPTLIATGYLRKDPTSQILKKRTFSPDPPGETSQTTFTLLSYSSNISRLLVTPTTGRTHQIRATLFSLGYPIVGDKIYGLDEQFFLRFITDTLTPQDRTLLIYPRQALHATTLQFVYQGTPLTLHSPPPF